MLWFCRGLIFGAMLAAGARLGAATPLVPVVTASNYTFRIVAANLTDSSQTYREFGLRLLRGLKPDVVAIQEFNYSNNTPATLRAFVSAATEPGFAYHRETEAGYNLPNGILSRWPVAAAGSWRDPQVSNRGFAWARVDLPGTNDLYVVSVHLHSNGGANSRALEAGVIRSNVLASFPSNAWIVVAGDFNTDSRTEACLATFRSFLADLPPPNDGAPMPDSDTNQPRNKPYDHILPSFSLAANQAPTVISNRLFTHGLVFDSRVFQPLAAVGPVRTNDSGLAQHMAVAKDFRSTVTVTNWVPLPPPLLALDRDQILRWSGSSNVTYRVEASTDLAHWSWIGSVRSTTKNFGFTNAPTMWDQRFWRLAVP